MLAFKIVIRDLRRAHSLAWPCYGARRGTAIRGAGTVGYTCPRQSAQNTLCKSGESPCD